MGMFFIASLEKTDSHGHGPGTARTAEKNNRKGVNRKILMFFNNFALFCRPRPPLAEDIHITRENRNTKATGLFL